MSLTSFIKDKEAKEFFRREFKKPLFIMNNEIKAEPITKNYSLVGTAFDYLLRFYLSKLNNSKEKEWVSENSLELVEGKTRAKIKKIIKKAKLLKEGYVKNGEINDELIRHCIYLAQIDIIFRASIIDEKIGVAEEGDVEDLKNLISIVNKKHFMSKRECVLNPIFNKGSMLVGGADCDLVIDESIIEIKTTKRLSFTAEMLNQLIGYFLLYKFDKIDGFKGKIKNLGVYFSRHGILFKFPVSECLDESKIEYYLDFVSKRATDIFGELLFKPPLSNPSQYSMQSKPLKQ